MSALRIGRAYSVYLTAALIVGLLIRSGDPVTSNLFGYNIDGGGYDRTGECRKCGTPLRSPEFKYDGLNYCESKECRQFEKTLKRYMDDRADPCYDFYDYACKWANESLNEVELSARRINEDLMEMILFPKRPRLREHIKKVDEMFQACVGPVRFRQALKDLIYNIGGWPIFNPRNWDKKEFKIGKFYTKSLEFGYIPKSFFTIDVVADETDDTVSILHIKEADETFDFSLRPFSHFEEFRSDNSSEFFFYTIMRKICVKYGVDLDGAVKDFADYLRIRKLVQEIYRRNPVQNEMISMGPLSKTYRNIPWVEMVGVIVSPRPVFSSELFLVKCPSCLRDVDSLISSTTEQALSSYLMWSLVLRLVMESDTEVMASVADIMGWSFNERKHCARKQIDRFRRIVDFEYINNRFSFDKCVSCKGAKYFASFKNTTIGFIQNATLFNAQTKSNAITKVRSMFAKIGYDQEVDTEEAIDAYYSRLVLRPREYFLSVLNVSKFEMRKKLRIFPKSKEVNYLHTTFTSDYIYQQNAVYLGPPVLTGMMYSRNRPEYLNYGTLGFHIGREISHAFDNVGFKYNAKGDLKRWWRGGSDVKYLEKLDCFRDAYSFFINPETGNELNLNLTIDEIIADNGGMQLAYKSYEEWLGDGVEDLIHNFATYTRRQLFWLSFAQSLCRNATKEEVLAREKNSVYPEGRIRVNGVVRNSADFAQDWECPPNSGMNPLKKCTLWT